MISELEKSDFRERENLEESVTLEDVIDEYGQYYNENRENRNYYFWSSRA